MAEFLTSYMITNDHEGGYANDKDDKGEETYRGVARNFHAKWAGWKIIDSAKSNRDFPEALDSDNELQHLVEKFYLEQFWNKINGDFIKDQNIANEVYDNAVNMGVRKSGEYLQRAVNILNKNQLSYSDISVDGDVGPKTLTALHAAIRANSAERVLNVINGFQVKHYIECMEREPRNEKYVGWFKRVEIVWRNN
ncbi:MAG: hypothetical protein K9I99_03830 [Melioribacteraceae bacterium]|nr:hypothetical protein [Melioribacteraceae bacterium]MCF8414559.1 hypothetical protein [Melioribacteraceae bacterium]